MVIATPPCQGMSVANHKKNLDDIKRNSLVIESINIINTIKPKFFIFENVPAFMKTICTDVDGNNKSIEEAIQMHLGDSYNYFSQILNFKNYGGNSSRTRTLVIGVRKDFSSFISPLYNDEGNRIEKIIEKEENGEKIVEKRIQSGYY